MSKKLLKIVALLLPIALLMSAMSSPAIALIQKVGQPRLDEAFMKVIQDPDAATTAFQLCEVEFYPDMIRKQNVYKLLAENQTLLASPAFHYCYIAMNTRSYVPDDAGQPDAGRPLAPLNWTDFRMALLWAGLSHAEKEAAILEIYGGPLVTAVDSFVPPAYGVWHYEPPTPPGCQYAEAKAMLEASGFTIAGSLLIQPNGVPVRDIIEVIGPAGTPTSNAFTQKWVDKWNDFVDNFLMVTNCNFWHNPIDFNQEIVRAYTYRNFDMFFLCYGLGRFTDYLYSLFHSSQDFPDGDNCYGIHDAELDALLETVMFGTVYEEKLQASLDVQQMLLEELVPGVTIYSRTYFTAFKDYRPYTGPESPYLVNAVNQKGYGADNGWTWGLLHWHNQPTGGSVKYVLGYALASLHPGWATSAYEWDVLNRIEDGLMALSPELGDMPWMCSYWKVEPFIWEPLNVDGIKIRFQLREGLKWQDGMPITVEDIKFAMQHIFNYPRLNTIWQYMLWSQIVDPCTIDIYLNTTSQYMVYNVAGVALEFPKHIYDRADSVNASLWEIDYEDWTGVPPPAAYPFMKALIGCGPYVFDYWSPSTNIAHIVKYQEYFVDTPIKQYFIHLQRVDPGEVEYSVVVVNTGSKDASTEELVTAHVDAIEITLDGEIFQIIPGFDIDPFEVKVFGPYTVEVEIGNHYLDCHTYVDGVLVDTYESPLWMTLKEDVNMNINVGVDDIFAAAAAFGSQPPPFAGWERWDERCDMFGDYYVGIDDIFDIAVNFGWGL